MLALVLALGLAVTASHAAHAHKVVASAYASGLVIEGEVGFSNGDPGADVLVEVFDETGNRLGQVRTDATGSFTFRPVRRVVHVFRANLGAGHVAEIRMAVEDMPEVPGSGAEEAKAGGSQAAAEPSSGAVMAIDATVPAAPSDLSERQREVIAEVVRREMRPLRQEITAYKEKHDLQSILGGIGYIFGLFGIGFYLAARQRLKGV